MSEDNNFNNENAAGDGSSVNNESYTAANNPTGMADNMSGMYDNAPNSATVYSDSDKPKRNIKPVIAVVAMLAVIAMAAGVFFFSKSALGKNGHIITALRNTFVTEEDAGESELDKLLAAGKCAIDMQFSIDEVEFAMACDIDRDAKQMSASGSFSDGNDKMGLIATIDDTYFRFTLPEYINGVFEYNFTGENTGYLVDVITKSTGLDISEFNRMFSELFNVTESQVQVSDNEYTEMLLDDFNELDFEKTDSKEFSVAGETKSCKGYKTVVTKEVIAKWIDNYKELGSVNAATASNLDIIKYSLGDFSGMAVTVYIADEKIAAVDMDVDGDVLTVKFEGKENPLYNIVLINSEDGENAEIRVDTTKENNDVKTVVTLMGEEIMSASYSGETGAISVTSKDEMFIFEGSYKCDEKGLELVIDKFSIDGESFKGMFKISDEVSIETIDSSLPVLDAGNATEDEFGNFFMTNMNMQGLQALYGLDADADYGDDELYDDSSDDFDLEDLEGLEDYDLEDYEGMDI